MKTIVVATDFSASADSAVNYAARLCRRMNASLLLLHTYQMPVTMSDMPVMMVSAEELKNSSEKSLHETRETLLMQFAEIEIKTEARLGELVDEINSICKEHSPLAVVIGTKGYKGIEKLLFGNTPMSVIRNCSFPVITVPQDSDLAAPKEVALATDLKNINVIPTSKISEILSALGARLHIIHVTTGDELPDESARDLLLQQFESLHPAYKTIRDDDVVHGVNRYIEENQIDLLVALPHEHNVFEKMFFKLHTEGLIEKTDIPVMAVHPLSSMP